MTTPSERLAELVISRLANEGLVVEGDTSALKDKLARGTLKREDWRLAVEKSGGGTGNGK